MKVTDVLQPALTRANLTSSSKKTTLEALAGLIADQLAEIDEELLFSNFISRERLGSTGFGDGVAIPHCRLPGLRRIHGALITLTDPIDFDSADQQPVDVIFALVVPEEKNDEHLATLAAIAGLFSAATTRQQLRRCDDDQQLYEAVLELDGAAH